MIVYKLFRLKGDKLYPLFINRNVETKMGVWLQAENHITKGFAPRQGWHCTFRPFAPHLKTELASGEKRVWVECSAQDIKEYSRPESQGGSWVLAQKLMVNKILTDAEVKQINYEFSLYGYCVKHGITFSYDEKQRLIDAYTEKRKEDFRRWKESENNG